MIKERAMELVAELRSGKHKQGRRLLHQVADDKKCCLGVACFISKVASPHRNALPGSRGVQYGTQEEADAYSSYPLGLSTLPRSVTEEFGFYNQLGSVRSGKLVIDGIGYFGLADANDKGVPFDKIADAIEQNWERL